MFKYEGSKKYNSNYLMQKFNKEITNINGNQKKNFNYELQQNLQQLGNNVSNVNTQNLSLFPMKSKKKKKRKSSCTINNSNQKDSKKGNIYNLIKGENISIYTKNKTLMTKENKDLTSINFGARNEGDFYLDYNSVTMCTFAFAECWACSSSEWEKKNKIISKAISKINKYLDIYKYIQRMQEVEVIKKVLFDKEKMILFDYVCKPSIKMSIRSDENFLGFTDPDNPEKEFGKEYIDLLYHNYSRIKMKSNKHYETRQLLKLVDSELTYFQ